MSNLAISSIHIEPVVPRKGLHQEVADRLRQLIIEGQLAPGTRLNERLLTQTLGVSRTPLREAYKMLAADGLITLLPNVGAQVTQLSPEEVAHTFELLSAYEGLIGELAAQRASDEQILSLEALNKVMREHRSAGDLAAYYRANREIHQKLAAFAANPVLQHEYLRMNAKLEALRFRSNLHQDKWEMAMHEHDDMVAALKTRDSARLGDVLRAHLLHKRDAALALLAQRIAA
jgi:DNA-binding GntR family transcriptional regulator